MERAGDESGMGLIMITKTLSLGLLPSLQFLSLFLQFLPFNSTSSINNVVEYSKRSMSDVFIVRGVRYRYQVEYHVVHISTPLSVLHFPACLQFFQFFHRLPLA